MGQDENGCGQLGGIVPAIVTTDAIEGIDPAVDVSVANSGETMKLTLVRSYYRLGSDVCLGCR